MIIILRGNKPFLIEKEIYTEHPLAKELKDNPISNYIPEWQTVKKKVLEEIKKDTNKPKKSFKNF